jgi:protein-ribulosamine 3-kinase
MAEQVPNDIVKDLERNLPLKVLTFQEASGGCINHGGKLTTSKGPFFLKWNSAMSFPEMFEKEAKGLSILKSASAIQVPKVEFVSSVSQYQYLLLEYVASGFRKDDYWSQFGEQLACLHQITQVEFGLEHDNYIGSLAQINAISKDWIQFFIEKRLQVQIDLALKEHLLPTNVISKFEKLFARMPDLLIPEQPSLLHGDLWSGNLMTTSNGMPCLIDPAIYFGHREVDLAMTRLFGGFDNSYMDSYHATYPPASGFKERLEIYKLYPLLVHVNLFGKSYLSQVVSILDYFV